MRRISFLLSGRWRFLFVIAILAFQFSIISLIWRQCATSTKTEKGKTLSNSSSSSSQVRFSDPVIQSCDFMKISSTKSNPSRFGRPKTSEPVFWLAIPAVFRGKFGAKVLNETIQSILQGLDDTGDSQMRLVIGLADADVLKRRLLAAEICREYHRLVDQGKLVMVSTPVDYYPSELTTDRCKLARKEGDSLRRVLWRTKQLLDSTYLMQFITSTLNADPKIDFLLKLEDDSPVNPVFQPWMTSVRRLISTKMLEKSWSMLRLFDEYQDLIGVSELSSTKGLTAAFGLLFPMNVVDPMVKYMIDIFDQMPVDWAIGAYLDELRSEGRFSYQGPGVFVHRESVTSKVGVDTQTTKEMLEGAEIVDWAQCKS